MFLWTSLLLLLAYAGLMAYYRRGWGRLRSPEVREASIPITVLIPARNEADRIGALLQALNHQTYTRFDVIVIDDHSTDGTSEVVRPFLSERIRLIQPAADAAHSSKKKAIDAGVRAAAGTLIVTTDADCLPPAGWLSAIASFAEQTDARFIAAPVRFTSNGSPLHRFQALDFLTLQGITAASVATGFHDLCNGANLAYTKEAFLAVNGFEGIDGIATGDDLLLMHKIHSRYPDGVHYLKSREAIVTTPPMPTWSAFLNQRRRWASKSFVYRDYRIIAVILLVGIVNLWWLVLLTATLQNIGHWPLLLAFPLFKALAEYAFLQPVARFYGQQRLLPGLFYFQPLHLLYTVFVGLWSQFGRYEWKGRITR